MSNLRARPVLRIIDGRKPSVLDDRRAVADFTRVCEVVGIIDSETGLIRDLPPYRPLTKG